MTKPIFRRGSLRALLGGAIVSALALTVGCLERPVVEQKPNTSNVFVDQIQNKAIDKIDLLFVIDNSTSMADKQAILEVAVPKMLERLVTPDCVQRNADGVVTDREPSVADAAAPSGRGCSTDGFSLEFEPITDIHIGVITSSLGGHGSTACQDANRNDNDKGYLIPNAPVATGAGARGAVPNPTGKGFLVWYPTQKPTDDPRPPEMIEGDLARLSDNFRAQVVAAGEVGCGFEAPLEAWYRFLVDPNPPAGFTLDGARAVSTGRDEEVINQRRDFLRPDSLVAIVVLTDENDCSAMEGGAYYPLAGYGWYVSRTGDVNSPYNLPISTAVCNENPNDPCCFSCLLDTTPSACKDANAISVCTNGSDKVRTLPENDRANVRCYQNKRRFGVDLLYPTDRYVKGLKNAKIDDSQTDERDVPNPLLAGVDGNSPRDPSFVFFAGIVGVPWQDIATAASLSSATALKYLNAAELAGKPEADGTITKVTVEGQPAPVDRWAIILGDPGLAVGTRACAGDSPPANCGKAPIAPLDPFMVESINARTAGLTNPVVPTIAIGAVGAATFNPINGNEYDNEVPHATDNKPRRDDIQYACTFPLFEYDGGASDGTAIKEACVAGQANCDCGDEGTANGKNRPLCRRDPGDAAGTTQYWGKAYPGTRILEVLKGFGDNSIVASICPKVSDPAAADFGYNPAVGAIVDRLAEKLGGQCLPRGLTVEDGEVPCTIVEALDATKYGPLDCKANGREDAGEEIRPAVVKQLIATLQCKDEKDCDKFQLCGVKQLSPGVPGVSEGVQGSTECLNSPKGTEATLVNAGYCYIDPAQGLGAEELVATCPATQRRLLRFVGADTPKPNSVTFVACTADAASVITGPVPGGGGAGN
ncbi:MAG TPA: hypothetical protein VLC09_19735 [Polyangiaceae bacterium]|nr:hypothetical protein [Polyangiaceae bacterium]